MNTTITRINPDLPVCWEDTETLRVGFEQVAARVRAPSAGVQRLVSALRHGMPATRIPVAARRLGATAQETLRLLSDLRPALQHEENPAAPYLPAHTRPLRAMLFDNGRDAPGLRQALAASSAYAFEASVALDECELVFHVERFLEPLEFAQRWLAAGVPHLLIRYTDRAVQVGPLVAKSLGPCHSCLSLARVAADSAAPALAAQLHGKRPQSETADAAEMVSACATLLVRQWQASEVAAHRSRITVPMARGRIAGLPHSETVVPHPGCGCRGL